MKIGLFTLLAAICLFTGAALWDFTRPPQSSSAYDAINPAVAMHENSASATSALITADPEKLPGKATQAGPQIQKSDRAFESGAPSFPQTAKFNSSFSSSSEAKALDPATEQAATIVQRQSAPSVMAYSNAVPGNQPEQNVLQVPQNSVVPAVLASPNPDFPLTSEQQAASDVLAGQFLQNIGSNQGNPNDATYAQRWNQAQSTSDQLYKLHYGTQAYLAQNIRAATEAANPASQ